MTRAIFTLCCVLAATAAAHAQPSDAYDCTVIDFVNQGDMRDPEHEVSFLQDTFSIFFPTAGNVIVTRKREGFPDMPTEYVIEHRDDEAIYASRWDLPMGLRSRMNFAMSARSNIVKRDIPATVTMLTPGLMMSWDLRCTYQ